MGNGATQNKNKNKFPSGYYEKRFPVTARSHGQVDFKCFHVLLPASSSVMGDFDKLCFLSLGIIVRCIQRLDETCRDVKNAARIIGDPDLVDKMEKGSSLIKRDIVFAGSLYTT